MYFSIIAFIEKHEAILVRTFLTLSVLTLIATAVLHIGSLIFLGQGGAETFKTLIQPFPDAVQTGLIVLAIGLFLVTGFLLLALARVLIYFLLKALRFRFSQDEDGVFICYSGGIRTTSTSSAMCLAW